MQKYLKLQQLGFKQKQKNGEKNLSEGLKVRLASGWAQSVNFMLGIDAEPPTACVVGLRSIGKILYVYISIQLLYTYVYVYTQTPTTTTPHACNRHWNKEGQHTAGAASLSTENMQYARTGVRASQPRKLKYPFDTKRKMFSKTIDMIHYAFAVS